MNGGGNYAELDKKFFDDNCKGDFVYTPTVIPIKGEMRIIAIGDIHGDYDLAISCLKLANVIDDEERWIGNRTIVVQIGDQLDGCRPLDKRCDEDDAFPEKYNGKAQDIEVMKLFHRLSYEAYKKGDGSRVISLIGNHELMNIKGNFNYVAYNDLKAFENYIDPSTGSKVNKGENMTDWKEARIRAFDRTNNGEYARFLACSMVSSVIIGGFVFVHAGILEDFAKSLGIKKGDKSGLYKLTYLVRQWLLDKIEPDSKEIKEIMTTFTNSPFWIRIFGEIPHNVNLDKSDNRDYKKCKKLFPALKLLGVDKMVIGHTPQFFKRSPANSYQNTQSEEDKMMNSTCDGKLWKTDVGSSYAFDKFDKKGSQLRNPQVLEIIIDGDKEKSIKVLK